MLAAIHLNFDPSVAIFGTSVRLDTLAFAGAILVALLLAAVLAGRSGRRPGPDDEGERPLRRDDLILIAFGVVPGAVAGGRIGYGLIHLDYYQSDPLALFDPFRGGMELTVAVLLGSLTAIAVAKLLAAPVGRWLGVASVPLLLALGLGKLAMVLGGAGQGNFSDASYATQYVRPGLWGSANADLAAIPSQALEGGLVLGVVVVVLLVPFLLRLRLPDWGRIVRIGLAPRRDWMLLSGGYRYLTVLVLWAMARFAAASTWRDAKVLGSLVAEQLILIGAVVLLIAGPIEVWAIRHAWAGHAARRLTDREKEARAAEAKAVAAAAAERVARRTAERRDAAEEARFAAEAVVAAEEARLAAAAKAAAEVEAAANAPEDAAASEVATPETTAADEPAAAAEIAPRPAELAGEVEKAGKFVQAKGQLPETADVAETAD
jgi:prolipoprotein diacylglyceryltransferase